MGCLGASGWETDEERDVDVLVDQVPVEEISASSLFQPCCWLNSASPGWPKSWP